MYYFFDVRNEHDKHGKKLVLSPAFTPYTLDILRDILYNKFRIEKDTHLSYIDDEDEVVPIDSECEFLEALKSAYTTSDQAPVVLLVHPSTSSKKHSKTSSPNSRFPKLNEQEILGAVIEPTVANEMTMFMNMFNETNKLKPKHEVSKKSSVSTQLDTVPPPWFTIFMESMEKKLVSAITQEVTKRMTDLLNKHTISSASQIRSSDEFPQSGKCTSPSKLHHQSCVSSAKINQKSNSLDERRSSDSIGSVNESRNINVAGNRKQQEMLKLKQDLKRIKNHIRAILNHILMNEKSDSINQITNNQDVDASKKQEESIQSNEQKDSAPPAYSESLPVNQYDKKTQSEPLKIPDGELRMNCSITGNQLLDGGHPDIWCVNKLEDTSKANFCSGNFVAEDDEEQEEDSFVIIEMPTSRIADQSFVHLTSPSTTVEERDSSRDSPSFELVSETPSTPSSMYMNVDEEHFSRISLTDEESPQPFEEMNQANSSNVMDDLIETYPSPQYLQTDSNDFTQSFHSHTTSVTGNFNAPFVNEYKYSDQSPCYRSKTTTKNHQGATIATAMKNWVGFRNLKKKLPRDWYKKSNNDADKCFQSCQSNRENTLDESKRTSGEQMPDTVDPIHILPETLVTTAAQMGSIAYVTARDMFNKFDKLRSHT